MDYIKISVKNEQNVARIPVIMNIDSSINLLALTEEQLALLKWLQYNVFDQYVDEEVISWDTLEATNFKEIK